MVRTVKRQGYLTQIVNLKLTRSYAVPDSFFLGAKVMKRFSGKWYLGTVDELERDENTKLWHVTYDDFDGEDLTREELAACLVFHPLLNTEGDMAIPKVGSLVWFSQQGQPRLGEVLNLDPAVSRPLVVHLYEPRKGSTPLHRAQFRPILDKDTAEPMVTRITLHQVIYNFEHLSATGFLLAKDRNKLHRSLSK